MAVLQLQAQLPMPLLFLLLLVTATLLQQCHAEKDSNIYPWGSNPNTHFKMYWGDAANVLQDLSQFQALYVQVHGCVWSECGVDNFDDDGENHDGDESWYQSRTRTFCANAAFSLYGIRKNNFKLVNTCSKGTYINTFFTYRGADTLAKALDLNINTGDGNRYNAGDDDSYATSNSDCVAVEGNGRRERHLSESGDEDNNQNSGDEYEEEASIESLSTSMGCAASPTSKYNRFVLAGFSDAYCSGRNFLETLDTLKSYNKALYKVSCTRIWSLKDADGNNDDGNGGDDAYAMDDDNSGDNRALQEEGEEAITADRQLNDNNNDDYQRTYSSAAEELLYNSWACDLSLYPNQCPDPYGLKRKYFNVMKSAANGQPIQFAVWNARLRKPIQICTWLLGVVGAYLMVFAYTIRNRSYIRSNGGGARGFASLVVRDVGAATVALQEQVKSARARHMNNRKSRRGGGSSSRNKSNKDASGGGGLFGNLFGKKKKKKKKKKRDKEKRLQRSASGRSLASEVDQFNDEASVYTELTDEYSPSQRSRGSGRHSSANYSSSRTSKAAEAAFAAAAQFDLEQQQIHAPPSSGGGGGNRHHHPSILPSASYGSRNSSRRSKSGRRSKSTGRGNRRGRSRSPTHSEGSRSQSLQARRAPDGQRRTVDPSPTRSPGGTSIRQSRGRRSKSPQPRVFV